MLDIELFRENPEVIRESEKRRGKDVSRVDKVVEVDQEWRETVQQLQELQEKRNSMGDEIAELKQSGEDATEQIEEMQQVKQKISELEEKEKELKEERDDLRYRVGNILHESVPKGEDEEENVELRTWEQDSGRVEDAELAADILEENDLVDTEKATEISGERAYFLKGDIFRLNQALINFAMDVIREKGYIPMQTPFMLQREQMEAAAELEDFHEQLYSMERSDKYLIATSEQTLANYHYDEILDPDTLPRKYGGFSTNFRREAGKHGTQTRGIWRIHQFEKVEQYIFCEPGESWERHEELIENSEDIMKKLGLPYRVVNVCTGDMNDNAAKKYDIEVWRPPLGEYGEVVSCSNCTDYQARKVKVRIRRGDETETAHTLNATALATERIITAIVENNQSERGIEIPEPLQDYMGREYIETN